MAQGGEAPRQALLFHDAVLYESDLELLRGPAWLNDHAVLFWQQFLVHERFKGALAKAEFLQPAAAFSLQFLDAEELLVDTPDNLFRGLGAKQLVLAPVVEDADAEGGGGSHWMLVVASRGAKQPLVCLDSSRGAAPARAARTTAARLAELMGLGPVALEPGPCEQQTNGYDCGVHVCANAERVLSAFAAHAEPAPFEVAPALAAQPAIDPAAKRLEMLETALACIATKEQSMAKASSE